eukprot:7384265-Prymnesium_polylepis.1
MHMPETGTTCEFVSCRGRAGCVRVTRRALACCTAFAFNAASLSFAAFVSASFAANAASAAATSCDRQASRSGEGESSECVCVRGDSMV